VFDELLAELDDEIAEFLILYKAFLDSLSDKTDAFRSRKLSFKVDKFWERFNPQRRKRILSQLIKDGVFSPAAIEMVRIFNGTIITLNG